MSRGDESFKAGAALIIAGATGFYQGLKMLKLRRKIQDIPTSKIASAAIGSFVEVHGKVYGDRNCSIESPLSGKRSAAFIWELYKLTDSGKNRSWILVHTYYSTPFLYIQDESSSGLAALELNHCAFQEDDYIATKKFDDRSYDIPLGVRKFLNDKNILDTTKKGSLLFSEEYKIKERAFTSGQVLYVLGTAISPPERQALQKVAGESFGEYNPKILMEVNTTLQEVRNDKELFQKYDRNADSILDREETASMRRDIEKEMFDTKNSDSFFGCLENTKICFTESKNNEKFFNLKEVVVSKKTESDLSLKLMLKAIALIVGGPFTVVIGLWLIFNA